MAVTITNDSDKCQVYRRRWLMLFLYIICSMVSYMQFVEYSIIADAIVKFYGVSYEAVNWTAMILLLFFIPFIFPGVYLINKLDIRNSLIVANLAMCVGSWIKVGSASPDRFWVYILGQCIVGTFQVIICALPVPIAAAWFGENEVSTACGLSIFGLQLGVAIGFVVPPMIVHNGAIDQIQHELYILTIGIAAICTIFCVITFLVFENEPPIPPSPARLKSKVIGKIDFLPSLLRLIKNRSYILLLITYGIDVGVFYGISTLLNQIVLSYYPDAAEDAGRIGVLIIVSGMFSAVIFGIIMDKFHKFRETTLVVYFGCFLSVIAFTFALPNGLPLLYGVSVFVGFFTSGLIPVGYEVAVELTYPEPECISSGLVQIIGQAIGIGFIYLYSFLLYTFGDYVSNFTTAGLLLLSCLMVFFIRFDLKRRKAQISEEIKFPQICSSISKEIPY